MLRVEDLGFRGKGSRSARRQQRHAGVEQDAIWVEG